MTEVHPNQFQVEHQEGRDLRAFDPALGYAYTFGSSGPDAILYEAFVSPIARRALDICQLSKSTLDDTISGLESYRRFQHLIGIAEAARYHGRNLQLDTDTILSYTFVAILEDLGHGVQSHKTDIMMEGVGGRERFHEKRTRQAAMYGGLAEIFQVAGVPDFSDARVFEKAKAAAPPWVESSSGHPNLDNFNYIAGESRIWFPGNQLVEQATALEAVTIDSDGQMVFKDHDLARVWGKTGLLLSSEHWNDPVNRLIMIIGVETIKRSIFKRYLPDIDFIDNGHVHDPEDYTFLCDADFNEAFKRVALDKHARDDFMTAAYQMLRVMGSHERDRYETHKKQVYEIFLADHGALEYPSAYVNPHIAQFGNLPVFIELLGDEDKELIGQIEGRGRLLNRDGEPVGYLKNFKVRQYDPLVFDREGNTVPLSTIDKAYAGLLEQHTRAITYTEAMQLLMNHQANETFCVALEENQVAMEEARLVKRPLSPDQLRRVIKDAGERATQLAINKGMWREV